MATRLSVVSVCVTLALVFGVSRFGLNVAAARQYSRASQGTTQPQQPHMPDMLKMHEEMMAEMKAADAKLDTLVQGMNAANGEARVTAIAAVVNELVQQHKAMHSRMGEMHKRMMGGRGMMMGR
ncbi:MAG TPA: hypothetical protein VFT47_17420 [Vicinamibacterales bacterium]|nr:hypothetical protein [Vicinamibacterales bacterium]